MSSDDGIEDYHRSGSKSHYYQQLSPKKPSHQPLSIHNDNSISGTSNHQSNHSIASASTQTLNCCDVGGGMGGGGGGGGTIKRRKSASTTTSNTLSAVAIGGLTSVSDRDRSNDDDELHMLSSGSMAMQKTNSNTGNVMCASPSRYMHQSDGIYMHLNGGNSCIQNSNRLSIHHPSSNDRYDTEITTCCLPPPSPAPNSDRFIMGMPSPSITVHHAQHQTQHFQPSNGNDMKFATMHHRSMSPSSRYKTSMTDRYRDVSPKCDRFLPPPHYLANSTPLVSSGGSINNISMVGANSSSSDNYIDGYLSTTVHTPVKRYIPSTNATVMPAESNTSMSTCTMKKCATPLWAANNASERIIAYRKTGRIAADDDWMPFANPVTPKWVPNGVRMDTKSKSTQTQTPAMSTSFGLSSSGSGSSSNASSVRSSMRNSQNDHNINSDINNVNVSNGDVYNNMSSSNVQPTNIPSSNNGNGGTCLHCSTIRRTTGVHQTTQTGPISPTMPQSMAPTTSQWDTNVGTVASNESNNDSQSHVSSRNHTYTSTMPYQQQSVQNTVQQQQQLRMQIQQQQQQQQQLQMQMHQQQPQQQQLQSQDSLASSSQLSPEEASIDRSNSSRKYQIKQYVKREVAKFFGVDAGSEERERVKWAERQKRLALRRFGSLKPSADVLGHNHIHEPRDRELHSDRPDILPVDHIPPTHYHLRNHGVMNAPRSTVNVGRRQTLEDEINIDDDDDDDEAEFENRARNINNALNQHLIIERKASVSTMFWIGIQYIIQILSKKMPRNQRQWSRSFAPHYINRANHSLSDAIDHYDGIMTLPDNELFFDSPNTANNDNNESSNRSGSSSTRYRSSGNADRSILSVTDNQQQPGGWRTRNSDANSSADTQQVQPVHGQQQRYMVAGATTYRGTRISSHLLEGVLDNSRRPPQKKLKLLHMHELDDRYDHRPYFTYWINTVQILVLCLTLFCYGFGPIGIGMEQKNGQVLVTSLSLQQVQHQEPRNIWLGPRGDDLVHLGAKFAACMRRDLRILDVMAKTRRQERETACCIRNDDSGCVQSSQADCSVRGLWPTKSISTWKKWSPGESGPGGRISGSVCGLDPKYCDAPASIAPYEWPDDITKWPICRKTNSFSQRFRYKDHTAEHMVCEVIGHPCCIGVYGECRITTKEFCDFVNGYFHEEASLCSQVSCLNDICGMFPFISPDIPDQFYRLFTSLCLHAGIIHLAITVAFQHIFMADLERLLGPIRTAILYIGSGIAGNLTSSIFLPYKPEVGPLASIAGVVSSMAVLLLTIHWKQLKRPHMALMKLIFLAMCIFAIGTLPWQQHIIGLMSGIMCGIVLTITMVPFLSITKYARKSKINLVWTCIILHLVIYASMFILFYLFPMALSTIGWLGTDSMNINSPYNGAIGGGYSVGGNIVACDNNKGMQCGGTSSNTPGGIVRSAINI